MAKPLSALSGILRRTAAKIESNVEKACADVAIGIGEVLIPATPVDTSRARANWQTTLNSPASSVLYPEPDKPPSPDTGHTLAMNALKACVVRFRIGSTIYIVNNVHYIKKLNSGSSAQAPAGFVLLAVNAGIRRVKNIRVLK